MIRMIMLAAGLLPAALPALAATTQQTTIHITGTAVVPPCVVNGGSAITVAFGNIALTDVSNPAYQQVKNVPVTCTYFTGTPYVRFSGTQLAGAPTNVLTSTATNFGVALYQGSGTGTAMTLGNGTSDGNGGWTGFPLTTGLTGLNSASSTFTFTAAPYQAGALTAGNFMATATMSISYQ